MYISRMCDLVEEEHMTIYIDNDYKCHAAPGEGLREFDVPFFDNKCKEFIEGYRYVPAGEEWTREDGMIFTGVMITPWIDYRELIVYQVQYLEDQLADADRALEVLYGDKS